MRNRAQAEVRISRRPAAPDIPLVLQAAANPAPARIQPPRPPMAPAAPARLPRQSIAPAAVSPLPLAVPSTAAAPIIQPQTTPVSMSQNEPGALTGILGGPGTAIVPDGMFTPQNLGIFAALLNRVGMVYDLTRPFLDWPGTVRGAWQLFTKGVFGMIGFEPVKDPNQALLDKFAPIRPAEQYITHRAPRGYVVVEWPEGSGQKMAMKKDLAKTLKLYKEDPKALLTVTDVKAVNRANAALKRVQGFALKKNLVEKCAPAGFGNGIVNKKTKHRTRK